MSRQNPENEDYVTAVDSIEEEANDEGAFADDGEDDGEDEDEDSIEGGGVLNG